jgi:cell division protease FtsH
MALGYTMSLPDEDRYLENKSKFEARLAAIMGGRAAEEISFNEITTGAGDDLNKATRLARAMVTQYGMSKKLGPQAFGEKEEMVFLGKEIGEQRNYSDEVARQIDHEVRQIINNAHEKARQLIIEHKDKLDEIAQRLLKEETLDAQAFEAIFV